MRTTSRKRTPFGSLLAIAAAALLVVLVVVFRHGAAGLVWSAAAPLVHIRNTWSDGEVADLRAELASTTAALADRDLLAVENAQLRQELGHPAVVGAGREILAGVLEGPPGMPYDTLTLDAGSALGVKAGARVFAGSLSGQGVAIGSIDAVYTGTSRVTLYSAPGQSYQAFIAGEKGTVPVVVEGQGAGSMQARVPAGTLVAVGDGAVFPGIDGGLVAKVLAVSAVPGESFKTLYLQLPVNLFELRYVYIQK